MSALKDGKTYTSSDIEALPEGERAELIDGDIYYMTSPSRMHQRILQKLSQALGNHIDAHKGKCEVYPAPFAVWPFGEENDTDYLEPDISVVCNPDKLTDKGCSGAPDFIVEIVSPSTASRDYLYKLNRYQSAGVREYWIVNPDKQVVSVFDFSGEKSSVYLFSDTVESTVLSGFTCCLSDLL